MSSLYSPSAVTQHCCGYAGMKESGPSGEEEATETLQLSLEG